MLMTLSSSTVGAVLLLQIHPWLLGKWTHGAIVADFEFVALYAVWSILDACGNAFAMFLNGAGVVGLQVRVTAIFVATSLPLKIFAIKYFGLSGLISASIAPYLFVVVGTYGFLYKNKFLAKSGR
jgi:hypothetical protein